MSEQQPWPDGVIARYLTIGGATVEITDGEDAITGTCTGCPKETQPSPFHYDPSMTGHRMESWVKQSAAGWAQAHAEKCRALPRPR